MIKPLPRAEYSEAPPDRFGWLRRSEHDGLVEGRSVAAWERPDGRIFRFFTDGPTLVWRLRRPNHPDGDITNMMGCADEFVPPPTNLQD
jgi:hypothetical protein